MKSDFLVKKFDYNFTRIDAIEMTVSTNLVFGFCVFNSLHESVLSPINKSKWNASIARSREKKSLLDHFIWTNTALTVLVE